MGVPGSNWRVGIYGRLGAGKNTPAAVTSRPVVLAGRLPPATAQAGRPVLTGGTRPLIMASSEETTTRPGDGKRHAPWAPRKVALSALNVESTRQTIIEVRTGHAATAAAANAMRTHD